MMAECCQCVCPTGWISVRGQRFLSDLDEVVESVSGGTQRKKKMTCTKSLYREIELERICSKLVFLRIDMKKVKVVLRVRQIINEYITGTAYIERLEGKLARQC